jgi:hypothetical protein
MSVIRFLHTDGLRLGSAVAWLGESPDWLKKVARSAVRTAVTNVIEAAIASRCQLLLIAGRLTESDQDLELAVTWLRSQSAVLKEHGIHLVLAGYAEHELAALRGLDAILVTPEQRLDVWRTSEQSVQVCVTSATMAAPRSTLGVQIQTGMYSRPLADLAYVAIPSITASANTNSFDGAAAAHDRHLRISAGSPQAIVPSERGVYGCQIVEADIARQTMTARFCATDSIRYVQELITCPSGMSASELCSLLRERSRSIATSGRCTVVVDWLIDASLSCSAADCALLDETTLLRELRGSLHAGHSGAWPSRIRFSALSALEITGHRSIAVREFLSSVRGRIGRTENSPLTAASNVFGTPIGSGSEAIVGLRFLQKVA